MTVSTQCTSCGKPIELADKWEGQPYACPVCGHKFVVRDQSAMVDGSMILDQIKPTGATRVGGAVAAATSAGASRIAPAVAPVAHAQLHAAPVPLGRPPVKMDLGMGDDSSIAMGLILLGYGAAILMQIINIVREGGANMPLLGWIFLGCCWLAMFAIVAPITNIGIQLTAKIIGQALGPTLFRTYGLLAVPPAATFVGYMIYDQPGALVGLIVGLLLMAPMMWLLFGLCLTHTLIGFALAAAFFVIAMIIYAVVVFLLVLMFGAMGMALYGKKPPPQFAGPNYSQPAVQPPEHRSLFSPPSFAPSRPPPPRTIQQKQYTLIDSTDAAVKVLGESDPAERRRALTYLSGLDLEKVSEPARFAVAQALKERLDDREPDIASRAGPMLVKWSPTLATDAFMRRLDSSDATKRRQAMNVLVELGDKRAIPSIVARLADDTSAATAALAKFGSDAEPAVIDALASDKPELRRAAMNVLQDIGTAACITAVKPLANDAEVVVAAGARALWKKFEPQTFDTMTEAMLLIDSPSPADRVEGLKKIAAADYDAERAAELTPKIERLLEDIDADVAMAAAKAVGKYHRDDLADELAEWFDEPTDDVTRRKVAMLAVGSMHHVASAPRIVKWLAIEPRSAVDALTAIGSAAEPAILAVMPIRDDKAMAAACEALGQVGTRRSLIMLNSASQMRADPDVRAAAKAARQAIIDRIKAESAE